MVGKGVHSVHSVDSQARGVHSLPASFTKRNQWNKAVSEAEKLVSWLKNYYILKKPLSSYLQEQLKMVDKLRFEENTFIIHRLATPPPSCLSGHFLTMTLPTSL